MVISWLYIKNKTRLSYPKGYCFLTRLSAYMEILVGFTWNQHVHLLARMSCWVLTRAISLVQLLWVKVSNFLWDSNLQTLTQWFSNCRAHLTGDSNKDCLCIACVCFVKPESLCEDLLFICIYFAGTSKVEPQMMSSLSFLTGIWQNMDWSGRTVSVFARMEHRPWQGKGGDCRAWSNGSRQMRKGPTVLYIGKH